MSEEDRRYYQARAEQELEMAHAARNPQAARVHNELAGIYRDRVDRDRSRAPRPTAPRP